VWLMDNMLKISSSFLVQREFAIAVNVLYRDGESNKSVVCELRR